MPTTRWATAITSSLLLLLLAGPRPALGQAGDGEPQALAVPVLAAPELDGDLSDETWKGAPSFEVGRAEDRYGRGRILRHGRQLHLCYESDLEAVALGVRFAFVDPMSGRQNLLLVTPLQPPQPPLAAFRQPAGREVERLSAAGCEIRFDFSAKDRFTFEMRVPLTLLEFGRDDSPRQFGVEVWDLQAQRTIGIYPLESQGLVAGQGRARLLPEGDWGAAEPAEADETPVNEALALLERIESERGGQLIEGVSVPETLRASMGWEDGHRKEAPLADLERKLEELAEAYPDYASLRANLIYARMGRNDIEGALEAHDRVGSDYPYMVDTPPHFLMRAELLRGLGRFEEAIADLSRDPDFAANTPGAGFEILLLRALVEARDAEVKYRAEEAARDDLPRVLLKTNRGDIVLELFEDDAPNAVANFVSLVERGFYHGTRFHWCEGGRRVIGGDPNSRDDDPHNDGFGGPGYRIESEPSRRLNLAFHVAFADGRAERRSEGSAFIIHITPFPALDGVNSVIGRVVEGQDVVRRLEYYDEIESAKVLRKRKHDYAPTTRPQG